MKKILLVSIFIFLYLSLSAIEQWENPKSIRDYNDLIYMGKTAVFPNRVATVWTECQEIYARCYVQMITDNGEKLWGEQGIPVIQTQANQYFPTIISSDNNSVIVCWMQEPESANGLITVRAQKINANGELLWTSQGIELPYDIDINKSFGILSDHQGGFYFLQNKYIHYGIKHYNSAGEYLETVSLDMPEAGPERYIREIQYVSDLGFLVRYSSNSRSSITAFDNQGECLWGHITVNPDIDYGQTKMIVDSAYVYVFGYTHVNDLYVQKYDYAGQKLFGDSPLILAQVSDIRDLFISRNADRFALAMDGYFNSRIMCVDTTGVVLWSNPVDIDYMTENMTHVSINDNHQVYLTILYNNYQSLDQNCHRFLKFSDTGSLLTEASGIVFSASSVRTLYPATHLINNQLICIWKDSHFERINAQIINASDENQYPTDPLSIKSAMNNQTGNYRFNSNGFLTYVVWEDQRNYGVNSIYLQILDQNGNELLPRNGKFIASNSNYLQIVDTAIDNEGQLIVWWASNTDSTTQSRVQKINGTGDFLFDLEGLLIFNSEFMDTSRHSINICGFDDLYFYTYVLIEDFFCYIIGQRVNNGNVTWEPEGREIVNNVYTEISSANMINTQLYQNMIFWNDQYMGMPPRPDRIMSLKLDEEGNPVAGWDLRGKTIFTFPYNHIFDFTIREKEGKTDILFTDIDYNSYQNVIKYNALLDNGTLLLNNPLTLLTGYKYNVHQAFGIMDLNVTIRQQSASSDADRFKTISYLINNNSLTPLFDEPVDITQDWLYNEWNYALSSSYENTVMAERNEKKLNVSIYDQYGNDLLNQYTIYENRHCNPARLNFCKINENYSLVSWSNYSSVYEDGFYKGMLIQKIATTDFSPAQDITLNPLPFTLKQNYPNPFNPSTTISYHLKKEAKIELSIYNIKGQKVKTLVSEIQPSGEHQIVWNGHDQQGKAVSSGIYFYKLSSNDKSITRKMMLIK